MSDPTLASSPEKAVARSVPPISRLSYFDVLLGVLRDHVPRLDELRVAIGRHVEDLSTRGEARRTRDWRQPMAYRDTVVACTRELVRWGFVAPMALGDDAASFEQARDTIVQLTDNGRRLAALKGADRREVIGQKLIGTYVLFQELLMMLKLHDVHLPEFSDSMMRTFFPTGEGAERDDSTWQRVAEGCELFLAWRGQVRRGPQPTKDEIAAGVAAYVTRRFAKHPPKSIRDLTGAVNKALGSVFLKKLGFSGELNAFERCLRWSRDLYLANDGRHVLDVPGWITWAAAEIRRDGDEWSFERRGISQHRQAAKRALVDAYRRFAEVRQSGAVQVPLVPIYEVRETAAFECRVCDEVVDRVLGDLALRRDSTGDVVVQLQIADARDFVPSARPFVYEEKRYFYVTMHGGRPA